MLTTGRSVDRRTLVTGALLLAVTVAAWTDVIVQSGSMAPMGAAASTGGMATERPWPLTGAAFVLTWGVMMAAMMLPSAAPMILLYRAVARQAAADRAFVLTWVFVLGYLLVWTGFGVPVFLASQAVGLALMRDPALSIWVPYGVAMVLLGAGLYQFTPLKRRCLRQCQSPLAFLMGHWRAGPHGALRVGIAHALYCCGCCWGLMVVLVAAGAMGLAWVVLIALAVFAEKVLPRGQRAAQATGVLLLGLSIVVALRPELAMLVRA